MNNLLIISIILVIFLVIVLHKIYIPKYKHLAPFKATPKNTAIAFDLNGVILNKNIKQIIKIIIFDLPKGQLLSLLFIYGFWKSAISYLFNKTPPEYITEVLLKHKKFKLVQSITNIINSQTKNKKVIEIIKELKQQGYKVYLASNNCVFKSVEQKFKFLSTLFDGYIIPTKKNNYIRKPNIEFYNKLKQTILLNNKNIKHIVFIDNYLPNIKAALSQNIYGITFNSWRDLIKKLKKTNILIDLK